MKATQLRELTTEELQQKHDEWANEFFGLRIKHALGQLENPLILRTTRRNLARARTMLHEQGVTEMTRRRRQTAAATARKKPEKKNKS